MSSVMAPLSKFIEINPESINSSYSHDEIEYTDISSVGSGYLIEAPKILPVKEAPSRAKRIVRHGDTILATVRPNLRSFLFIKNPEDNSIVSTGFAVLRAKEKVDPRYIYYAITDNKFTQYLTNNTKGTSYPAVDSDTILRGEIPDYDYRTQHRIVSILSAYDDLIENNRRRIQLLEQAARLLYKEWFVHLRFPGHEHTKIIKGIPEGWKMIQVKELLSKVKRPGKIQMNEYLKEGSIPCIDQSREFIGGYTENKDALIDDLPMIVFGDHTRILKFIDFPFACGADGTQLISSNDPYLSQEYFFFALDAIDLSNYFYARHFKFLKDQYMPRPINRLIEQFTDVVKPIMRQIKILRQQDHYLSNARDLLLPRLMNGAIAV